MMEEIPAQPPALAPWAVGHNWHLKSENKPTNCVPVSVFHLVLAISL